MEELTDHLSIMHKILVSKIRQVPFSSFKG